MEKVALTQQEQTMLQVLRYALLALGDRALLVFWGNCGDTQVVETLSQAAIIVSGVCG